jgi:hypothetical protein
MTDEQITGSTVMLSSRSDWPSWFAQLQYHARSKGVWELVNPDVPTTYDHDAHEPKYPTLNPPPVKPAPVATNASTEDKQAHKEQMQEYDHKKAAYDLEEKYQHELVNKFKFDYTQWQRTSLRISSLRDWVNKTVSAEIMMPLSLQSNYELRFTLRDQLQMLKTGYAPTDANTAHLVRLEYRAHLEKAKYGRITPEKWFGEWQVLYGKAKAFGIPEVQGEMALTDFLDALTERISTEWAPDMRRKITYDAIMGNKQTTMDELAKVFNAMLQERLITAKKGKGAPVFATFSGKTPPAYNHVSGSTSICPCKKGPSKGCAAHKWEPIKCRRLETALTGVAQGTAPKIKLTDFDRKKILERVNKPEWADLRSKIKDAGWNLIKEPTSGSSANTESGTKFPGSLVAALLDPASFNRNDGVYITKNPAHYLSMSTILDSGAAVHLVNDRDLLEPGTFKPATSTQCIDAGTQSLPISGTGTRVLKGIFNGKKGPHTEDLTLTDVRVVEGFHVNIVSSHKLKLGGAWYMGLDDTLRHGAAEDGTILMRLHRDHNLIFMEYKPVRSYPEPPVIVNATKPSWIPQLRTDSELLWHQRSGHLGKRAVQALAYAAQNVRIDGTRRSECEHCSTAHASQVISRRPRERSPRPFYRISWDLFDFPTGRTGEEFAMIIKEEFSGKLTNENLQRKSLPEIMKTLRSYVAMVRTKYELRVVEIHQDNDTATAPWRGCSQYEEWAAEEGIKVVRPPPYTHEPNGSAERAGKELITKSIKMRTSANLPEKLWPEIMDAAAYLYNMSPTALHSYRSPNEVLDSWFQQYFRYYQPATIRNRTADLRPDWSGIYSYGCKAYPLSKDRAAGRDKRGFKVNPRAHIGYLVGYRASNIYIIWVPKLDQVITTRDVSFNENEFFTGDLSEEMSKEGAIKFVDILHDDELVDLVQDIEVPEDYESTAAHEQHAATEGNLGGEPVSEALTTAGQPHERDVEEAEAARGGHTASDHLRIRAGRVEESGLVTPDPTPEPDRSDRALRDRGGDDSQQAMHRPGRAGSSNLSDQEGSHGVRQERPPNRVTRTTPGDPTSVDETGSRLPARRSRRQHGEPPERDIYMGRYLPERKPRKRKDHDDQMGGGGSTGGVHALIADIQDHKGPWSDFHDTYLPGLQEAWQDRASYKTLNAVVMSAMLNENSRTMLTASTEEAHIHRDELPKIPKTWKQLENHPYGHLFKQAAIKEISQLLKQKTWIEIQRSSVAERPLPLKWVFSYKCDQDGFFTKCKARICVRGDLQDVNTLNSTYAATLAAKSFRTAIAIAAEFDLEILQYDVVGAFLNALITAANPVICELPDGFKKEGMCVRLNRALYGLRDSPLLWYEEFAGTLRSLGLSSAKEEPCLFFDQDKKVLVLFYVDDILLLFHKDHEQQAKKLWDHVMRKYEIQDQGPVDWFVGVRVIRNRKDYRITLVHDAYIDKITKKYRLEDGTFPLTPLPSQELIKNTGEASKQKIKAYQERVGSVLYTAIMIRPDVAYSVSKLSHFLTNPSDEHIKAVERVIMYLYRTRWHSIQYGNYNGPDLTICGDASFADDPETRRSSHGYIALLFGGAIFWKATRQSTITTSTTEAELLALEHVTKELMALRRFFKEITLDLGELWNVWCDNQQTIRLVVGKNERINTRLRHVDIQNMWLRQEHAIGSFQVEYLETNLMPADGLTKSLTQQQFEKFKELLNLQDAKGRITEQEKKF